MVLRGFPVIHQTDLDHFFQDITLDVMYLTGEFIETVQSLEPSIDWRFSAK